MAEHIGWLIDFVENSIEIAPKGEILDSETFKHPNMDEMLGTESFKHKHPL